ncbi:hypothetical protein DIPPA_19364 [Diplonema papillatum]|nr:hypothetical protein DIPPA_19364 [Diplonema papillatum]
MQNGIRHLRHIKIWYRPDVKHWDRMHGGMKTWVDEFLPSFQQRNPEIKVELKTVEDPAEVNGDHRFPRLVGYWLNGTAQTWAVRRYSAESINSFVHEMRNTCNDVDARPHQAAVIETHTASVQGKWTPYLWMRDEPAPEPVDHEARWKSDVKEIAKYVRMKKEHRESEFEKKNQLAVHTRRRMEERWQNEVFPYTVGTDTQAVPGRLYLDETRSIFQEAGSNPPPDSLGAGDGFMGGFVRPFHRNEMSVASGGEDKYSSQALPLHGGDVPPFAGAPFTSGYGDYENFWKNWDLFHYSSVNYRPPLSSLQKSDTTTTGIRRRIEKSIAKEGEMARNAQWQKES